MAFQESTLQKQADDLFLSDTGEKQLHTFSVNTKEEADVNRVLYIFKERVTTTAYAVWPQLGY